MAKLLIQALADSKIYQEFERAFNTTTGMPLALRSVDSWQLPHHNKPLENPFCTLLSQTNSSCAACLKVQQELARAASRQTQTVTCLPGLSETAVPVRMGEQLVGFLTTGQVFLKKPTERQFKRTAGLLAEWGVPLAGIDWRKMYFDTRVLSPSEHSSVMNLLKIFAEHLAMVSNQVFVEEQYQELPIVRLAKEFIGAHQHEKVTLQQVAQAVNTSTFYFCKVFKKATGMHFTDYLARVRTEKAKTLLLNPNLRVSEIAFETGFQSLTHFNRVFKRVLGCSPTSYREQLAKIR